MSPCTRLLCSKQSVGSSWVVIEYDAAVICIDRPIIDLPVITELVDTTGSLVNASD